MNLPSGLFDKNVEIFEHEGVAYALYDGKNVPVTKLPKDIYNALFEYWLNDTEAFKALDNSPLSLSARFNIFLICRFGSLDHNPDFDTSKVNFTPEYFECGKRDNCPYGYKLCARVKINDAFLTKKEIEIVKLIAKGLTDIQTAGEAHIELNTLLTHKKNIYSKLGIHSQAQLTSLAKDNNLI